MLSFAKVTTSRGYKIEGNKIKKETIKTTTETKDRTKEHEAREVRGKRNDSKKAA